MCIEHPQSTPCICKVQQGEVILPDNQVVYTLNCKKRWYSLANVANCVDIDCHQSWKPKVPQDESHICGQSHHNDQPLHQRLALVGKKSSSDVTFPVQLMLERAEDLQHKPCATADLHCLVMQEQMPNMTPNALINVTRPLNASKCQCHLTITMAMIPTIIVMWQHMHKTIAPLQLNRLQQATISWYWRSRSWSQTVVGQQDDRFIQQLPLLLAHMPKSDCLCNCAHECIRCNLDNHHCECLPVLKEKGVCHVAVGIVSQHILYLMRPQIRCNYLPVQFFTFIIPKTAESIGSMTKIETPYQNMFCYNGHCSKCCHAKKQFSLISNMSNICDLPHGSSHSQHMYMVVLEKYSDFTRSGEEMTHDYC